MWSAGSINGHMDYIQYIQYIQSKKDALTKKDLAYLKKHFPDFKWVLLQPSLNENVHWLIDVGVWKSMHPGGNVFDERMYKDITKKFFEIPYHHGWDNGLKDNVIEKMKKYKRATVRL
jgi:hypothetical protein